MSDYSAESSEQAKVIASTIGNETTSYPMLFKGCDDSLYYSAPFISSMEKHYLEYRHQYIDRMTSATDIAISAEELNIRTGKIVDILSGISDTLRISMESPVIYNSGTKIGDVQFNVGRPLLYDQTASGMPVDSLTLTQKIELYQDDYVVYKLNIRSNAHLADTIILESVLQKASSGVVFSSSGEIKIPPTVHDSVLNVTVEMPAGMPQATAIMRTVVKRGNLSDPSHLKELYNIIEYSSVDGADKRAAKSDLMVSGPNLVAYPNILSSGTRLNVQYEGVDVAWMKLYDVLGREVTSMSYNIVKKGGIVDVNIGDLPSGQYIIAACVDGKIVSCTLKVMK